MNSQNLDFKSKTELAIQRNLPINDAKIQGTQKYGKEFADHQQLHTRSTNRMANDYFTAANQMSSPTGVHPDLTGTYSLQEAIQVINAAELGHQNNPIGSNYAFA